ncbi:MAG: sulfotransferase domain-containing protein [Rhodospirillales bacterium]|jgi:hypothetical protein|nr:sulfotransferase domain-containing protein [Rhodospirillales bacterium]
MPILWLASYPKSGNTWLRAFLANYLRNTGRPEDINALPEFALGDMRIEPYLRISGKEPAALSRDEINRLRPQAHRALAAAASGLVPVKTHSAIATVGGVPTITPEVTFGAIYVIRNPLDVAVSFSHHYAVSLDQAVTAICFRGLEIPAKEGHVVQIISDWSTHVRSWLTASGLNLKTLRYEDMLASPRRAFAAVCAFLGMPKDEARLRRAIRHSAFKVLAEQERKEGFVERARGAAAFFRRGQAGGWREELTPAQVEAILACHRPLMTELGYLSADGKILV